MSGPGASRIPDDAAAPRADFPDRLNPVFVRELRRALRTPFFVGGFVTLQAVTFLAALVESGIGSMIQVSGSVSLFPGLVGGATAVAFGYLLPFANLDSLRSELGPGRNGELLVTAGLSPWQIVGGRVLVAGSTGAVLLASVVPYFLLRYFLGGTELTGLFHNLAVLYGTHVAMSAIVIGASVFANLAGRFLLIGSLGFFLALHQLPYRLGGSGLFLGGIPVAAAVGENLVSILFTLIGIQIALAKVRPLESPLALDDAGVVLVFAFLVLPFAHFTAFGLGGAPAGIAAIFLMAWVFYLLGPWRRPKNQLNAASPGPLLPES